MKHPTWALAAPLHIHVDSVRVSRTRPHSAARTSVYGVRNKTVRFADRTRPTGSRPSRHRSMTSEPGVHAVEVMLWRASLSGGRPSAGLLMTRIRFDQRALDGDALVGHPRSCALEDALQELPRHLLVQQAIPILGETPLAPRSVRPCRGARNSGTGCCNRAAPSAGAHSESSGLGRPAGAALSPTSARSAADHLRGEESRGEGRDGADLDDTTTPRLGSL